MSAAPALLASQSAKKSAATSVKARKAATDTLEAVATAEAKSKEADLKVLTPAGKKKVRHM